MELLTSALGELLLFRPTKKNAAADIVTDVLLVIAQLYLTTCQFQTLIWSWFSFGVGNKSGKKRALVIVTLSILICEIDSKASVLWNIFFCFALSFTSI